MNPARSRRPHRPRLVALAAAAAVAVTGAAAPATVSGAAATTNGASTSATSATRAASAPDVRVRNGCLESVPEPGSTERVDICYTLFKPAQASRRDPVPMVMHSHGWGGSRTQDPAKFSRLLEGGYAVLSFDQRGFGESGGKAHVENPRFEGRDVRRLVRFVAQRPWVAKDAPGDPRLGAIGGSYGGGYQFLGAMESLRARGKPVFDALAPEITWWDLKQSLAPSEVVRTEWALALSAAALPSDALPTRVYEALVQGAATGSWPDGDQPGSADLDPFFRKNGPKWHVRQGRRLDIPVLIGQGTTDTLFPLRQAVRNWNRALTPRARRQSLFVAYNGGHVLPAVFPRGVNVTSDPCSRRLGGGDFRDLTVQFFDRHLRDRGTRVRGLGRMHFATPDGGCTTRRSARANEAVEIGTVATSTAAGAPLAFKVAEGPIRIAGAPHLTGEVTALGAGNRAFYGLAVGSDQADAKLVQNNVLPFREDDVVLGAPRRIGLPAVAVDVPEGQNLYLLASPMSDTFVGMSSRTPGVVTIDDTTVHLPVKR